MKLTPRQQQILQLIVQLYGETEEPIGSRTLLQKSVLNVSPATIRNDMVALEQLGLLMKAHSSSGRIPSYDAYRFYINELMNSSKKENNHKANNRLFTKHFYDIQEFIQHSTERLAEMTGYPVVALMTNERHRRMRQFKLTKLSDYQLIASVITDHGHVESQLFDLPYSMDHSAIEKIEHLVRDELVDLTLDDVYQRMKLTMPLRFQQLVSVQLNFASLIKQAIEAHEKHYYTIAGKNHLFDLMDPQVPINAWKTLFDLIDGNQPWFDFLTQAKAGIDVTFDFECPPYHFKQLSIVTAKQKLGNHVITYGMIGPSAMPYQKVINGMKELMNELSNY